MRPVVADVLWSACVSHTTVVASKTDDLIKVPFGAWTPVGSGNRVLRRGPDPPREGHIWGGHTWPCPVDIINLISGHDRWLPVYNFVSYKPVYCIGWLGSRVVSVLDSSTVGLGPGFKSQSRRCRVTVLCKLFTPIVPLFIKQRNCSSPLKVCEGNCGPGGK